MKKKLLYILIALIAIGLVAVIAIFSITKHRGTRAPLADSLFQVRTYNDLEMTAKNHKISIKSLDMGFAVEQVDALGESMTFSYLFDQNDYLSELKVYCDFQADNLKSFQEKSTSILNAFSEMFNVTADQYYIYSSSEVFDCKDEQSIEKVFIGEATIEYRICDKTSSCWIVKITKVNSDVFICTINHYIDDSRFENMPVNVDLS